MNKILIYILLVITVLAGCKKVDIDVPAATPVFSVDATIDGINPIEWNAGDDDFFMFTEFTKDNLDIYTLKGRLAKDANCTTDCQEALTFSIRGNAITPTVNDFEISQALLLNTNLDYTMINDSTFVIINNYTFDGGLVDSNFLGTLSYLWTINGDTTTAQTANLIDVNGNEIDIQLDLTDSFTGCTSTIERKVRTNSNNCDLNITVIPSGNPNNIGEFDIQADPNLGGPGSSPNYFWSGLGTNDSSVYMLDSLHQGDNLFLTIEDLQGSCNFDVTMCLVRDSIFGLITDVQVPEITFNVQEDSIFAPIDEQFSHVEIEYQDSTGAVYSTLFNNNPNTPNNAFTISKVEEFEENDNGEKTKKLTISYDAVLYDNSGNSRSIQGSGVIGVAYPD